MDPQRNGSGLSPCSHPNPIDRRSPRRKVGARRMHLRQAFQAPCAKNSALGIESADAGFTVLSFRSALPTEMVDGIAPSQAPT